jgi:uncharacterized lipoprotein YbaY
MRVFRLLTPCALLLVVALASSCADLLGPPVVYGTATYRERTALPANARLEVTMFKLARGEGSSETIATVAVDDPGNPPIRFALAYDPARIVEGARYAAEATIRAGDRVLFRTAAPVPVLTQEFPKTTINIVLEKVPAPPPPAPVVRVSPAERALAALRSKLDTADKISGSYKAGTYEATYEAFLDGDALVAVREARNYGDAGSAKVVFYFRDGILVAYDEEGTRRAAAKAAGAQTTNNTTLALNFTGGRYANGRKTVNGTAGQPSETEIRDAVTEARDARDRLIADAASGQTSTGLGPVRFGCADGSKFLVTFSRDPLRAIITAVGHPSAVLLPQATRTGFRFVDGRTELRGKGREADIRWDGAAAIRCTAASP